MHLQGFHVYSVDWGFESISFAVDGVPYISTSCACANTPDGSCGAVSSQPFLLCHEQRACKVLSLQRQCTALAPGMQSASADGALQ